MTTTNYTIGDFPYAPQGWVCPKCGRVYSPNTFMCYYCGGNATQISTPVPNTTGVNPEKWWKDYITSSDTFRVHFEDLPQYNNKNGEE